MFAKRVVSETDSNKFIRPKNDGDSIKGVFLGKPLLYKQHWIESAQGKRSVPCGFDCTHCKAGVKAKKTFRCNFIVEENGSYTAKIYQGGMSVYDALAEVGSEYDLAKTLLKITRKGSGLDTSYSVIVAPPQAQPTAEKMALIGQTALLDLDPGKDESVDPEFAPATGEVPF